MARHSFQQGYRSEPTLEPDGWKVIIRYRVPSANGVQKHRSETLRGYESRKEARATANSVLRQRIESASNLTPSATEMTVEQFVDTYWRPYLDRKGVKPSTRQSYECLLKKVILPQFGKLRVVDVTPLHVEELLRRRISSGMTAKTVRNDLVLVQGIFSLAVDNDLIGRNPVRRRHKPNLTHKEKATWTAEEIRRIISAAPREFQPLFTCVGLMGLRLGELLGLQWKHVDFDKQLLHIKQALWNGQLLSPKTAGSIRSIAFGPVLLRALRERWNESSHRSPEDFVFSKKDGSCLSGDVLRRDVLYPTLDRLGLSRNKRSAGFHAFRHSAASFINAETGNLKLAQKLLGHSNLTMTAEVYTHTSADAERAAALAVERAIYGDLFVNCSTTANTNNNAPPN